jgi:hypothetical protein
LVGIFKRFQSNSQVRDSFVYWCHFQSPLLDTIGCQLVFPSGFATQRMQRSTRSRVFLWLALQVLQVPVTLGAVGH